MPMKQGPSIIDILNNAIQRRLDGLFFIQTDGTGVSLGSSWFSNAYAQASSALDHVRSPRQRNHGIALSALWDYVSWKLPLTVT